MKIAITSLYLPSGSKIGVGYQVHYFANQMVRRGHQVTVFSQSGSSEDSLYDVVVVPCGSRLRTFGFQRALRGYDWTQFDVLHACDDWLLWGKKRPLHVHVYMGSLLAETLHARGVKNKLRMGLMMIGEYASCFLADELVAISHNTRRYIPFVKKVIPCGVDLSNFSPCVPEEKSQVPTILFVGTLGGRKRGAMLLDIFQTEVRLKHPNAQLWCVCEEEAVGEGVQWFGRVPMKELNDLYRRAWVFCLPSTYEGFGVPYIEAMASGTPVIATPNDGAKEVLSNGQYGRIVEDAALGLAINELLGDTELRSKMREAGLRRAQEFGWDAVCAHYEALYQAGISKRKQSTFAP